MTLVFEIRLRCGDDSETVLAHETAHVTALTDTQRATVRRVAKAALDLVSGETVLAKPLHEHLSAVD